VSLRESLIPLPTLQTAFHLAHGADFRCPVSGTKLSAVSYQPSAFSFQFSAFSPAVQNKPHQHQLRFVIPANAGIHLLLGRQEADS
jgi:hypothetical protein